MPDISKCSHPTCPLRKKCYRFTSKPSEFRQAYGDFSPTKNEKTGKYECDYFMKIYTK